MVFSGMAFGDFDDPGMSDGFGGGDAFGALFGVVAVVIGLGIVSTIVLTIYRAKRMADRGQNPLTVQEDIAYQAMQSRTLAADKSLEQRLAELDDLHRRGVITDDEHRAARAEALRG
jgi:uncharacterized membrane protein